MPEIRELWNNDSVHASATWESEWLDVSSVLDLVFTGFVSQNYDIGIRWAIDNNFQPLAEEVFSVTGGDSYTFCKVVKFRKVQFFIRNIAVTPCILRSNGFFFHN
jgi:hypothetical protein